MGETSTSTGADRVTGVLSLIALTIACVLFAFIGVALPFFTVSCGVASTACAAGLVAVGTAVAGVIPWLLTVAGTISIAVRVRHGEAVGRAPWAWFIGAVLVAVAGVAIVFIGGGFGF